MTNTDDLVRLDNYSEDSAKFLLEMAAKENVIEIMWLSKKTSKLIILKREHLQEFINEFPNSILLSLHDGTFKHNALIELPDVQKIHYSCLWVDKVVADKLFSKEHPIKNKIQILSKLKIYENRPSNLSRDKSQRITQEFEEIIINGILDLNSINKDVLWKAALKQAEQGKSQRFKKVNNTLVDKITSDIWTNDLAYQHKKKVIEWVSKQFIS